MVAEGNPMPGERYRITLPDGTVAGGTLDENGKARVNITEHGPCHISFPNLDMEDWERV